ncbi:hypothetical protein FGO68_gene12966 [Halteria grandinella]|uniref:Uncharacterized protein n=1 Tax=Halteria grandinella TaxID=5974 RepID=A0A8J8T4W7_HALGN|nr:hypothetical protein FGO68_gene12966 [Halteria grandinella]
MSFKTQQICVLYHQINCTYKLFIAPALLVDDCKILPPNISMYAKLTTVASIQQFYIFTFLINSRKLFAADSHIYFVQIFVSAVLQMRTRLDVGINTQGKPLFERQNQGASSIIISSQFRPNFIL